MDREQIEKVLRKYTDELDTVSGTLFTACEDYAQKENSYRMAKAQAFIKAGVQKSASGKDKTVDEKRAEVDLLCESQRIDAHISEGLKEATKERIKSLHAIINAYQTIAAFEREQMRLDR
jgi:hypothetical protein